MGSPPSSPDDAPPATDRHAARRSLALSVVLLGLLAYVPALATARGQVAADTKQYLYLDPGRLLRGAPVLWDPGQFAGWVTHQVIGYLWPMGPWFRVLAAVGLPVWVAQRLWLGTLLFAAGTGVRWCARVLGASRSAALAAGVVYMLTPYLLGYEHRTSVLLLPWAGLGWSVGLAVLAGRRPGWRYPALFALVVFTVGGQNATAVLLCGLAPALWLLHAALVRAVPARAAAAAAARIGVLTAAVSAWWFVPILVQARYGADVLAYSETVEAVSVTSLASEVVRGLGYWLFYGGDVTGRWASSSTPYLQNPGLIALGFLMAALGVAAVAALRWPHRTYLALLVVVGVVVAVGAHPYGDPSPIGAFMKGSSARSAIILALRSSTRAIPLVLLAFALALAMVLTALGERVPRVAVPLAAVACGLAVLQLPSLWNGTLVDRVLRRPEALPPWWTQAAAALDAGGRSTRVFELPGAEFAAYRWGVTTDPILPGLTSRPVVTRDLLPMGTVPAMDLLFALDDRFQSGTVDPAAIAPVARLLGAGDIVLRGDAAFERYLTPRPEDTWALYRNGVPGLGTPTTYGPPQPNLPSVPMIDETALSDPAIGTPVPPVAVLPVQDPTPIVRARDASRRVVLDGSGDGVVDAAAAGVLDPNATLLYAASTPDQARLRTEAAGAALVVTDSNRERARQWRGSQDTVGYTEDGGVAGIGTDTADQRLPLFRGAPASASTLAEQRGPARVIASGYGSPTSYRPEDRPAFALDGDPTTAWRVGDRGAVIGQELRVELRQPRNVDHVNLVQALPAGNRTITRVRITTDAGHVDADLGPASLTTEGQTVALPAGTTGNVTIEITGANPGVLPDYFGQDAVGFSEVRLDGVQVDEVVRVPTDLLDALGPASTDQPLSVVLTRQRVDPRRRWRSDDERALVRAVTLPAPRTFALDGEARLSGRASDSVVAAALAAGTKGAAAITATTNSRLAGVPAAGGASAIDGNPATAWTTSFGPATGAAITVHAPGAPPASRLDLTYLADAQHSLPAELTAAAGGQSRTVSVPPPPAGANGPVTVPITFDPLPAGDVTLTITRTVDRSTLDRQSGEGVVLPVAIAELGLPGVIAAAPEATAPFDTGCRSDLLTIDGQAAPVRITGTAGGALAREPMTVAWCGTGEGPVLGAGEHVLRAVPGLASGLDLDRLVLRSAAGGAAAAVSDGAGAAGTGAGGSGGSGGSGADATNGAPRVTVTHDGRSNVRLTASGATGPFWLVFGQGFNKGWRATAAGHDLGSSTLVDGGFNGWLVTPAAGGAPIDIHLTWTPQRAVNLGLVVSALGVVACLVLLLLDRIRRRPVALAAAPVPPGLVALVPRGAALSWTESIVAALAAGVLTAVVVRPLWALPLAAATLLAARRPPWTLLLRAGAVGGVLLAGAYVVERQIALRPQEGFGWPSRFERAHLPVLLAVMALAADAVLWAARARHERVRGGGVASDGERVVSAGTAGGDAAGTMPGQTTGARLP